MLIWVLAKYGTSTYRVSWNAINGESQEPPLASACQNGIAPEDDSDCHARPIRPVTGFCRKLDDVAVTDPGKKLNVVTFYVGEQQRTELLVRYGESSHLHDIFNECAHCLATAINNIEVMVKILVCRRFCRIIVSCPRARRLTT